MNVGEVSLNIQSIACNKPVGQTGSIYTVMGLPRLVLVVKNPPANLLVGFSHYLAIIFHLNSPASAGDIIDVGFISGSGRSPGESHGNPL